MTSAAQASANRRNARRSTGPRTEAGKRVVARNAVRHGLAIPIGAIQEYDPMITRLAEILAGVGANPRRLDLARRAAEAKLDIVRVRRARMALLQQPNFREPAKDVLDSGGDPHRNEELRALRRKMGFPATPVEAPPEPTNLDGHEHFAAAIAERSSELRRLDRYERRALSRRKSAIRELDAAQSDGRAA